MVWDRERFTPSALGGCKTFTNLYESLLGPGTLGSPATFCNLFGRSKSYLSISNIKNPAPNYHQPWLTAVTSAKNTYLPFQKSNHGQNKYLFLLLKIDASF